MSNTQSSNSALRRPDDELDIERKEYFDEVRIESTQFGIDRIGMDEDDAQ